MTGPFSHPRVWSQVLAAILANARAVFYHRYDNWSVVDDRFAALIACTAPIICGVSHDTDRTDPAHQCPDGCLIDAVQSLASIARDDYDGTSLTAEDAQIQLFYTSDISLAEAVPKADEGPTAASLGAVGRLLAFGYYTDEANARAAVAAKRVAVVQSVGALDRLVDAHRAIVRALRDKDPDRIVGIVNAFVATYSADVRAIRKAYP